MTDEPIRCVVVDDNNDLLQRVAVILQKPVTFTLGSQKVRQAVDVRTVKITCVCEQGKTAVTKTSVEALIKAFGEPTDFVFTDFAFVGDQSANEAFKRTRTESGQPIRVDDCRPFTTYLVDVAQANSDLLKLLKAFSGVVVVYTNASPPFDQLFCNSELSSREEDLASLFENALEREIYNIYEALKPDATVVGGMTSDEFKVLMSNVIAMRLHTTLWQTTYRKLVAEQYTRRKTLSKKNIAGITTVGIALGAATAFFGDVFYHELVDFYSLFGKAPWPTIGTKFGSLILFISMVFSALFGLGYMANRLLEKLTSKLFTTDTPL